MFMVCPFTKLIYTLQFYITYFMAGYTVGNHVHWSLHLRILTATNSLNFTIKRNK